MSASSDAPRAPRLLRGSFALIVEPAWVLFAFFAVAVIVFGVLFEALPPISSILDTSLGQLLSGGLVYALVLVVVVLPVLMVRNGTYVKRLLGLDARPGLSIVWLPVLLWAAYMAVTIVAAIGANYLPWVDQEQSQNVGFSDISQPMEYALAFIALVVLPPIAEELLFRGYLFGRLRERFGFWLTTFVVSLAFGFVHLQWNVGIDTFILSLFLCYLRERTGSIWASMVLHGIKNGVAYFLLFIAPLIGFSLTS